MFIKYYFGIHCLCIYYTDKFSSFLLSDVECYLLFRYIWFTYVLSDVECYLRLRYIWFTYVFSTGMG